MPNNSIFNRNVLFVCNYMPSPSLKQAFQDTFQTNTGKEVYKKKLVFQGPSFCGELAGFAHKNVRFIHKKVRFAHIHFSTHIDIMATTSTT